MVSPIVDIFPYTEELDKEISRRPLEDDEPIITTGKRVYSAPGSDLDDETEEEIESELDIEDLEEIDSDLDDEYSEN
jgi:hypothetical protein